MVMLLYYECPADLEDSLNAKRTEKIKEGLNNIFAKFGDVIDKEKAGTSIDNYKTFANWFKGLDKFSSKDSRGILKIISSIPNREGFVKELNIYPKPNEQSPPPPPPVASE
jgi:hypothetical protein